MFQGCPRNVLKESKGISKEFQGCFKYVLRVFVGTFMWLLDLSI